MEKQAPETLNCTSETAGDKGAEYFEKLLARFEQLELLVEVAPDINCKYRLMETVSRCAESLYILAEQEYEPAETYYISRLKSSIEEFEKANEKFFEAQVDQQTYLRIEQAPLLSLRAYQAAIWGYARAQSCLGKIFRHMSIDRDRVENETNAAIWFKKAMDEGDIEATLSLADMYAKGFAGKEKDVEEAIRLFRIVVEVEPNNPEANCRLGEQLYVGGRPSSEYLFFLKNARRLGDPGAVKIMEYIKCVTAMKSGDLKFVQHLRDPALSERDHVFIDEIERLRRANKKLAQVFREENKVQQEAAQKEKQKLKAREREREREKEKERNAELRKQEEERRKFLALEAKKAQEQAIAEKSIVSYKMLQGMYNRFKDSFEKLKTISSEVNLKCNEMLKSIEEGTSYLKGIGEYRYLKQLENLGTKTDELCDLKIKDLGKKLCKNIQSGMGLCQKLQCKNGKPLTLTQDEKFILTELDCNKVIETLLGKMDSDEGTVTLEAAAKKLNAHELLVIEQNTMLQNKCKVLKLLVIAQETLSNEIRKCKKSSKRVTELDQKIQIEKIIANITTKIEAFKNGKSASSTERLDVVEQEPNKPAKTKIQLETKNDSDEGAECSDSEELLDEDFSDCEEEYVEDQLLTSSSNSTSVETSESETEDETPSSFVAAQVKTKGSKKSRLEKFLDKKKLKEAEKQKKTAEMLQQYHEEKTIKELIAAKGAGRPENLIFSRHGLGNNTKKASPQSPEARSYTDHLEQFGEIIKNLTALKKGSSLEIEDTYALLESFAEVSELVKYGTKDRDIIKVANHIRNALYKRHEMVLEMIERTPGCLLDMAQSWFDFLNTEQVYYFKNTEAVLKQINVRLTEVYELGNSLKKWHIDENGNKHLVKHSVDVKKHRHTVLNVSTYLATRPQESKDSSENTTAGKAGDASDKKFMALKFCCAVLQDAIKQLERASNKKIPGGQVAYKWALEKLEPYYSLIQNLGVLARHPITLLQELEKMPSPLVDELLFNNPLGSKEHSPAYSPPGTEKETKVVQDMPVSSKPVIIYYKPKGKSFPISLETTEEGQRVITELERMLGALNELNENSVSTINDAKDRVLEEIVLSKQIFTAEDIKKMFNTIWQISCRATEINTKSLGVSTNNIGYHALTQVTECSQAVSNILPKDQVTPCLMKM